MMFGGGQYCPSTAPGGWVPQIALAAIEDQIWHVRPFLYPDKSRSSRCGLGHDAQAEKAEFRHLSAC